MAVLFRILSQNGPKSVSGKIPYFALEMVKGSSLLQGVTNGMAVKTGRLQARY